MEIRPLLPTLDCCPPSPKMGPSIQQTLSACLSIQQMLSAWSLNVWMSEHRQEVSGATCSIRLAPGPDRGGTVLQSCVIHSAEKQGMPGMWPHHSSALASGQ